MFSISAYFYILAFLLVPISFALPQNNVQAKDSAYNGYGNSVFYELNLTWEPVAPNGHVRNAILMNGQFTGPALELNQGDNVEIVVNNNLPFAVTIHFHGIAQIGTPWSDGVPGISQRSIQRGQSFLYHWTATDYGTYWYHAVSSSLTPLCFSRILTTKQHERGHIMDGLYGPIIIKPSAKEPTAFGMISNNTADIAAMLKAEANPNPMLVSDWMSFTSDEVIKLVKETGIDYFCMDSVLINGKGQENCLSQDEINSLTNPALLPILNGTTLTPKG